MKILEVQAVDLSFRGLRALDQVCLDVEPGSLTAVIGPNGAGKTSLFNCISGLNIPQKGRIFFEGKPITGKPPHRITNRGVARTFQNLAVFSQLTLVDNLLLGCHYRYRSTWWHDLFLSKRTRAEESRHRKRAEEVIDFLDLDDYREVPAGILPYGILKRVELGRALCMNPRLILLDEPAAGLGHEEVEDMARYLLDIKQIGISQLLIEHDLRFVLDLTDSVFVLDFGKVIASGTPAEIRNNPRVAEAYLGAVADDAQVAKEIADDDAA